MMNYVMLVLVVFAILFSVLLGNTAALSAAVLESGVKAIQLCLELCGTVALWCGVMKIAQNSGLCEIISKLLSPVTGLLFPDLRRRNPKAIDSISMNITANLLGLGSAATPMALDAMIELDKLNRKSLYASDYMVVFVAINCASVQILPTTVATIRRLAGSEQPMEILVPVWLSTLASLLVAVTVAMALRKRTRKKEEDDA